MHTAGSRIDLPAPVNSRLHSNTRLSPATSCSSNSPQLRPSRVPKARALHSRDARRALQSLTMPARRLAPAAHRSACKQRSAQPRPTIQTDHRGSARPAVGTHSPTAAPPSAAEDDGSGTDSVQQMQELSRLLHQVIMLHMVDGGPLAEAGVHTHLCAWICTAFRQSSSCLCRPALLLRPCHIKRRVLRVRG